MPPIPDVPVAPTSRRFSQYYIPQAVYVGLDIEIDVDERKGQYAISVHDGTYTTDYYCGEIAVDKNQELSQCYLDGMRKLLETIKLYATSQHYKVQLVACSTTIYDVFKKMSIKDRPKHSIGSAFWRELDAVPLRVRTHGETIDERASAAVRKAVMWYVLKNCCQLH